MFSPISPTGHRLGQYKSISLKKLAPRQAWIEARSLNMSINPGIDVELSIKNEKAMQVLFEEL